MEIQVELETNWKTKIINNFLVLKLDAQSVVSGIVFSHGYQV